MGYIEKSLTTDEKIIYRGKGPWLHTFEALACLIVGGGVFFSHVESADTTVFILSFILFLIGLAKLIRKLTMEIAITNKRVVYKYGWLSIRAKEINLNQIEGIELRQGLISRMFGHGKLSVRGTGMGAMIFPPLSKPLEFRKFILETQSFEN